MDITIVASLIAFAVGIAGGYAFRAKIAEFDAATKKAIEADLAWFDAATKKAIEADLADVKAAYVKLVSQVKAKASQDVKAVEAKL